MYVVIGATGNTGRAVAETLLASGKKVRVVGRSAERLKPLIKKGAEPFVGSVDDPSAMARAFQGAKAVYAMVPPNYTAENPRADQNKIGDALARALAEARVTHVVNLSSLGAHLSNGAGPISGLHDVEKRLSTLSGAHIVHLRPAYFMENFLLNIPLIKGQGDQREPDAARHPHANDRDAGHRNRGRSAPPGPWLLREDDARIDGAKRPEHGRSHPASSAPRSASRIFPMFNFLTSRPRRRWPGWGCRQGWRRP